MTSVGSSYLHKYRIKSSVKRHLFQVRCFIMTLQAQKLSLGRETSRLSADCTGQLTGRVAPSVPPCTTHTPALASGQMDPIRTLGDLPYRPSQDTAPANGMTSGRVSIDKRQSRSLQWLGFLKGWRSGAQSGKSSRVGRRSIATALLQRTQMGRQTAFWSQRDCKTVKGKLQKSSLSPRLQAPGGLLPMNNLY